jgi:hypothetical protein
LRRAWFLFTDFFVSNCCIVYFLKQIVYYNEIIFLCKKGVVLNNSNEGE